jgi:DNA-binding PucR family transcriptional regulator
VQEAAKKMYVHRNTINYKIKKIESLTHTDVSSLKVREDFDIAFMLQEIVNEAE